MLPDLYVVVSLSLNPKGFVMYLWWDLLHVIPFMVITIAYQSMSSAFCRRKQSFVSTSNRLNPCATSPLLKKLGDSKWKAVSVSAPLTAIIAAGL